LKVESSGSRENPFNQYNANFQLQTAGGRKLPGHKLAEIQDVGIWLSFTINFDVFFHKKWHPGVG
jgi:hypothetical protein